MASHHPPFGGGYGDERGDPGAFVVEDLTQGLHEWRNIQDIVRLSFVALHKALQAQGDAIQALTEQTELRALKSDVRAAFETHEELLEVRLAEAKADDAGDAETEMPDAESNAEILERVVALERRAETLEARLERFATKEELEKASEETRAKLASMLSDLRGGKTNFPRATDAPSERAEREQKPSRVDFGSPPRRSGIASGRPRDKSAFESDDTDDTDLARFKTKEEEKGSDDGVETARRVNEMRVALARKADRNEVQESLRGKADADAVATALERLERAASTYATKADLHSVNVSTVTSADLTALAAEKVSVDEVNRALAEVSAALDEKASAATLASFARESRLALRGVAAETSLSVARWIWKSGRTKTNGLVPWNVQSVNTDPENFRWERDKTFVRAGVPGLYEVTFGFFARRKPAIRLLVDGEPVLAAVNSASYVTHHSSGRLTSATRHPAGNVTGLTLIDFLALPAKAKIAVVYEGETGAEGFLSLKKL
jgi:hypothetical protein